MYNNLRVKRTQPGNELLGVGLKTPGVLRQTIPRKGLVLEILGNGDVLDTSGLGNNGSNTNGTFGTTTIGYQNQCWVGNGSNTYINVPDNASLQFGTGDFSVSMSIKIPTLPGTGMGYTLISKNYTGFEIFLYNGNNGSNTNLCTYVGGTANSIIGTFAFQANTSYTISIVRSGTTVTQYVNTTSDGTATNSASASNAGTAVNIGRRTGGALYANTNIGQCRLYNRSLSHKERQSIYMEGLKLLH